MAKKKGVRARKKELDFPIDENILAQIVKQVFSQANEDVKVKLDNKADLTTLLPLGFFALGLVELFRKPQMPKWNECWWYSYSIFRDFNGRK